MTPHISAKKGEIAKKVLMPGDPLRAKHIAETYLEDYKLVSSVRNVLMFTGKYKGKEVSICASGMGQPSIGIYAYELFKFYDVEKIVRIGSAGSYKKELKIYDVVLADSVFSDSSQFSKIWLDDDTNVQFPSQEFNDEIIAQSKKSGLELNLDRVYSSDIFYSNRSVSSLVEHTGGAVCVEMESYALFTAARALGKKAACLLTISDNLITKEEISSIDRQKKFHEMFLLALEAI